MCSDRFPFCRSYCFKIFHPKIRQLRQKASKANSSYTADNKKKEQVQNELAKVEAELQNIDVDEEEMNRMDQEIRHLEHEGTLFYVW